MEGRWDEGEVGWRGGGMERGERYVHSSITINNVLHHDDNVHKGTKRLQMCVFLLCSNSHTGYPQSDCLISRCRSHKMSGWRKRNGQYGILQGDESSNTLNMESTGRNCAGRK